ncbi:hypothetical protein PMKS-000209 [Pichia membranifaciens]|uniref:Uncharacterized protein n=1 Tax=Pichia membranifaciens TaxID=4926 RepID=A0A1Q2YBE7_9ASCO|nr:hypothetical protein PMKS-000209 [Pichia membranifaciens]
MTSANEVTVVDGIPTESKAGAAKSRTRNRNKNRNSRKSKECFSSENMDTTTSHNEAQRSLQGTTGVAKSKKAENKKKSLSIRALFKELEKLLRYISPITINGLPVKNLACEPIPFLKKIIEDETNMEEIFMTFLMKPSDPDFPFDLGILSVTLCIPQSYPNKLPSPTIMVLNDDIPRGYGLNIEFGFKQIVSTVLENRRSKKQGKWSAKGKDGSNKEKNTPENDEKDESRTIEELLSIEVVGGNDLTGMVKTLDKYLEKFLSMEKKDTIKLVKVMNNKQDQEDKKLQEKADYEKPENHESRMTSTTPSAKVERYKKRTEELEQLRQRLRENNVTVLTNNAHGTTYKFVLYFKSDDLTVEFGDSDEVTIEKLFVKLFVPKEYLYHPKKGTKLSIDMSNNYNIGLVNSIKDTNSRLIFGKLINNISKNYDLFAQDICQLNCRTPSRDSPLYWTITSQLNFFVHNIQKLMNEKVDFQNWYEANKTMNSEVSSQVSM